MNTLRHRQPTKTANAAVKAGSQGRIKVALTAAATITAALITAAAMFLAPAGNQSGNNHVQGGDGTNCNYWGNHGVLNCVAPSKAPESGNDRATPDPPSGPPPWTFYVYDTVVDGTDLGLTVRACNIQSCGCAERNCNILGYARDGAPLYAFCQLNSNFNGGDTSTTWLKVAWPNGAGGNTNVYTSSSQDPYAGWVLKKYTTPGGHNGNIPQCH